MRIIETQKYKLAYSHHGTQPGFAPKGPPGLVHDLFMPDSSSLSDEQIAEIWGKRKKKRKKRQIKEEIPDQPY
jgi:hypothetical protein